MINDIHQWWTYYFFLHQHKSSLTIEFEFRISRECFVKIMSSDGIHISALIEKKKEKKRTIH
jgi:hypothetical protein